MTEVVVIYHSCMSFMRLCLLGLHNLPSNEYYVTVLVIGGDEYDINYLKGRDDVDRLIDFRGLSNKQHYNVLNSYLPHTKTQYSMYVHSDVYIQSNEWYAPMSDTCKENHMAGIMVSKGVYTPDKTKQGWQLDTGIFMIDNKYIQDNNYRFDLLWCNKHENLFPNPIHGYYIGHSYITNGIHFYDTGTIMISNIAKTTNPFMPEDTLKNVVHFGSIESYIAVHGANSHHTVKYRKEIYNQYFRDGAYNQMLATDSYPYGKPDKFLGVENEIKV